MKKRFLFILCVVMTSSILYWSLLKPSAVALSVYEKVQASGTIRCGYWVFEPYLIKDPNTGKMTGIAVDYLEKTAARQGKKIEWSEELGFDQIAPALRYGRVDAFCVPCSPAPAFEEQFDFVGSFGHIPYYVYVSFDKQFSDEDLKTAHFAVVDGFIPAIETGNHFPQAKISSLPQMTAMSDLYGQIKYRKVDAVLNEHVSAGTYMRENPNVLRRIGGPSLFIKDMYFVTKKEESAWRAFLDKMTDTTLPENRAIFIDLLAKYKLSKDALIP